MANCPYFLQCFNKINCHMVSTCQLKYTLMEYVLTMLVLSYVNTANVLPYFRWFTKLFPGPVWKQGNEDTHFGTRWSRKNHHPLQVFYDNYERASAASEFSLFNIMDKSQCERSSPARPETFLRGLYLSSHLTDSLAVFFIG